MKKRIEWVWDVEACNDYNIVARFEATLINLGIIEDYSDIDDTEDFVHRYKLKGERNG